MFPVFIQLKNSGTRVNVSNILCYYSSSKGAVSKIESNDGDCIICDDTVEELDEKIAEARRSLIDYFIVSHRMSQ